MSDAIFYTGLAVVSLITIIAAAAINRKRAVGKLRRQLEERWGKLPAEKYKSGDLQAISGYYRNYSDTYRDKSYIDDITWNDLDMDEVFKRMNSTCSTIGEEYLYKLLREPVFSEEVLNERNRLIEFFRSSPLQRQKLQLYLARLGKRRFTGISDYFFNDRKDISFHGRRYILQLAAMLVSPLVIFASPSLGLVMFIVMFLYNMTVYYKAKNDREVYMESLSYVINLINYSKKIAGTEIPELERYISALKAASNRIKGFSIKSFYQIFYQTGDIFLEPLKVFFLIDLIAFESLQKRILKHANELQMLYETIGMLDSMLSAASYRESLEYFTRPVIIRDMPDSISFTDAYHPLVEEPVANSLVVSKSILITGSNASGKSTFLKTAAINAILAQTIDTCLAREYATGMFKIYTSMALKDNLSNKESYYITEIKSLKRVFDSISPDTPVLCMIDEVLRGTNTIERIAASSEVLRHLGEGNCLCMAATHDIELVSILKNRFDNYHFQESFKGDDIIFDYRIYPGKSTTRNAIKLLRLMGYSEDVVSSAGERAERFAAEGRWEEIG